MEVAEQLANDLLKDLKRLGLLSQNQTLGSITADFELTCSRRQYLDFLDYVHGLERATYISVNDDDENTYSINMTLYCVTELQTEETETGAAATEPTGENPEQAA